jgi:hypothetical protein
MKHFLRLFAWAAVPTIMLALVAFGGPTVNFTVHVSPKSSGGVACDIGPNYTGSIPTAAQVAGFTHCAANYDFTTSFFSNKDTWFQCPDNGSAQANNGTSTALFYWQHTGGGPDGPCSDINMITDGGSQVLDLTFTPTDFDNQVGGGYTNVVSRSGYNYPNSAGTWFPNGSYIESVDRVTAASYVSVSADNGALLGGPWEYGNSQLNVAGQCIIEFDWQELYKNQGANNGGTIEHCTGNFSARFWEPSGQNIQSSYDATQYNTYGHLATQDTSGNLSVCLYLNGTPLSPTPCSSNPFVNGSSDSAINDQESVIMWSGAQNRNQSCGSTPNCIRPTGNVDVLYKRITIWTCPGYKSTTNGCAGTLLTSPP